MTNYKHLHLLPTMLSQDKEKKLIEIFIALDDFCKELARWQQHRGLGSGQTYLARPVLHDSEALTLLVYYHYSGYKCFQYYWQDLVAGELTSYFPRLISYERFIARLHRYLPGLFVFLKYLSFSSQRSGTYFIDSKQLPVCDNHRIHSNQVFAGVAGRGKSSTGWFYGLKLHLVINQHGEVINFLLTPGNVADNNATVLDELLTGLQGECYGDKGYLTTLFEQFYRQGLRLITMLRRRMKNKLLTLDQQYKLRKRALIESVNDLLCSVFDLEHTRHRSPMNACVHILAGLIAYCFYDHKPSVYCPSSEKRTIA